MKKNLSIVLLSGGLDSTVTLSVAKSRGDDIALLHVNYGQRTELKELDCFNNIASHFNVDKKLVVDISHLKIIGGSALTDNSIDVPTGDIASDQIPVTYVPFRNAHLLAIAVSWAEIIGAGDIYIGAVEEDSSGYPDCRREFFDSYEKTINLGTKAGSDNNKIKIITPLIDMKKSEIVTKGIELNTPLNLTWSCYQNEVEACGECDSCLLRLRGFKEAGEEDPILYKQK